MNSGASRGSSRSCVVVVVVVAVKGVLDVVGVVVGCYGSSSRLFYLKRTCLHLIHLFITNSHVSSSHTLIVPSENTDSELKMFDS